MNFNNYDTDVKNYLEVLHLSVNELSELIGVTPRTIYRWIEDHDKVPVYALQILAAWKYFAVRNIDWKRNAFKTSDYARK